MGMEWKESRYLNVPLTEDEVRARGEALARAVDARDQLEIEQKSVKERMKDALSSAEGEINKLARIVRDRMEERAVEVVLRVNFDLNLVEEVRIDSGEIIKTRGVTESDKVRSQQALFEEKKGEEKKEDEPAGGAASTE